MYYTTAAKLGNKNAIQIMGNAFMKGHGVGQDCPTAAQYYLNVADGVVEEYFSEIVGGKLPLFPAKKLVFEGGVFSVGKKQSALSSQDVLSVSNIASISY